MDITSIRTPSLGDATYIAVEGSFAVIVDPQRDIGRFLDVLDDRNLTLTHVLETHVHNDYISGGRDLARRTGADLVLPAGSGAAFPFLPAFHHEGLTVDIEDAIRLNATAVTLSVFVGAEGERTTLLNLGRLVDEGEKYGIPVLAVTAVGKDMAREIREYFIPDFSNWKDHDAFEAAYQRLMEDFKPAPGDT